MLGSDGEYKFKLLSDDLVTVRWSRACHVSVCTAQMFMASRGRMTIAPLHVGDGGRWSYMNHMFAGLVSCRVLRTCTCARASRITRLRLEEPEVASSVS
jgi:hypothetical protein